MVVGQSDSSTFKFDFSGINWSNDDPVSIVNAYREALKRQERQKKRRLLESQIVTNANRELSSVESSATISPTIPSASGSNREKDFTSNRAFDVKNGIISRNDDILSNPPSIIGSQVSEQSLKRKGIESPEERRRSVQSSLNVLWNSRNVPRRLLQNSRRNVRKHAPPSYFAQLRRPGEKAEAVTSVTSAGETDQNDSSQTSTGSVTFPGRMQARVTSDSSSLFSHSTTGLSEVLGQSLRPLYVDSITQTDTALDEAVNHRKRRLDVSDVMPDRKKRPGFFSADFEDSDDELKEIEVEEPFLKKRRLFANDGVTLASSPAFYRSKSELDGPGLHISPRKPLTGESNITRRRLELEQEEREQQQREKEERLESERHEKEAELERQRKELEEERKRQQLKQKELEEKERQLRKELLKTEQQLAEPSSSTPSLTPFGDSGAKTGFTMATIATPRTTQAISSDQPSFTFGLSTTTSNDKTATSAHSLPGFSFSSGSGATDTATTTNGDSKEDPSTLSSTPAPKFQFGAKSSMATTGLPFQFASPPNTPSSSATAVPPIVVGTQAPSSAPSTGFSFGATSGPSGTSTLSLSTKRSGSAEIPATSSSGMGGTSAPEFSFGKASTLSSAPTISTPSSGSSQPGFALTSNASATVATTPSHSQSVSTATTTQAMAAPSFSFGSYAASPAVPSFGSFGATPGLTSSAPDTSSLSSAATTVQPFSFGAGSTSTPNPSAVFGFSVATTAAPTFGSTTASNTPAPPSTPSFNFAPSTANPATIFGFGSATGTSTPAPMDSNGMNSSTPNMFASPALSGTPPPGRKLAPMRGRLRRR
ncbi:hypothetical protein V1517DRAFT_324807 [Lipomyces orientalis]|uniref:Uncharacterized protein n=1 Tax=Lipomyces orientalis TaxID=1233043 RepID=A0ACC3TLA8_9ASCO